MYDAGLVSLALWKSVTCPVSGCHLVLSRQGLKSFSFGCISVTFGFQHCRRSSLRRIKTVWRPAVIQPSRSRCGVTAPLFPLEGGSSGSDRQHQLLRSWTSTGDGGQLEVANFVTPTRNVWIKDSPLEKNLILHHFCWFPGCTGGGGVIFGILISTNDIWSVKWWMFWLLLEKLSGSFGSGSGKPIRIGTRTFNCNDSDVLVPRSGDSAIQLTSDVKKTIRVGQDVSERKTLLLERCAATGEAPIASFLLLPLESVSWVTRCDAVILACVSALGAGNVVFFARDRCHPSAGEVLEMFNVPTSIVIIVKSTTVIRSFRQTFFLAGSSLNIGALLNHQLGYFFLGRSCCLATPWLCSQAGSWMRGDNKFSEPLVFLECLQVLGTKFQLVCT